MDKHRAGAGLPSFERFCIKYLLIPMVRNMLSWESSYKLLEKEEAKIKALIKNISEEDRCKRVKIDRVFGIEDHSSDYSINMTLQHLSTVTQAMIFVIETLSKETPIEQEIKIENVKPTSNESNESNNYFNTLDNYKKFIQNHNKKVSVTTKEHPWFVAFNNEEWAIFNYIHTFVHRRQIAAIIKGLN